MRTADLLSVEEKLFLTFDATFRAALETLVGASLPRRARGPEANDDSRVQWVREVSDYLRNPALEGNSDPRFDFFREAVEYAMLRLDRNHDTLIAMAQLVRAIQSEVLFDHRSESEPV